MSRLFLFGLTSLIIIVFGVLTFTSLPQIENFEITDTEQVLSGHLIFTTTKDTGPDFIAGTVATDVYKYSLEHDTQEVLTDRGQYIEYQPISDRFFLSFLAAPRGDGIEDDWYPAGIDGTDLSYSTFPVPQGWNERDLTLNQNSTRFAFAQQTATNTPADAFTSWRIVTYDEMDASNPVTVLESGTSPAWLNTDVLVYVTESGIRAYDMNQKTYQDVSGAPDTLPVGTELTVHEATGNYVLINPEDTTITTGTITIQDNTLTFADTNKFTTDTLLVSPAMSPDGTYFAALQLPSNFAILDTATISIYLLTESAPIETLTLNMPPRFTLLGAWQYEDGAHTHNHTHE